MENLSDWTCESINRHFCNDEDGDCQKLCYMTYENMELHTIPIPDWVVFEFLGQNKKVKKWFLESFATFFYGYGLHSDSLGDYLEGKRQTPIVRRSVFIFHDYTLTDEIREDKTLLSIRAWVPTNELKYKDYSKFIGFETKAIEHEGKTFNWFDYSEPIDEFYFDHLATISDLFDNLCYNAKERSELRHLLATKRYYKPKAFKDQLKEWVQDIKPNFD